MPGTTATILHVENRYALRNDRETRKYLDEVDHPIAERRRDDIDNLYALEEWHFFEYRHVDGGTAHWETIPNRGNVWIDHGQVELPGPDWAWRVAPDEVDDLPPLDLGRVLLGGSTEV